MTDFVRIHRALFNIAAIESVTALPGTDLRLAVSYNSIGPGADRSEILDGDDAHILAVDVLKATGHDLRKIGKPEPLPPADSPLPDWCNFRVTGVSYDENPGAIHHQRIADRPQVVRPYEPDGKPAVDPRIVPGCRVRIINTDLDHLFGLYFNVKSVASMSVLLDARRFESDLVMSHPEIEFVAPPPAATFAPDMASGTFSDRVVGSPFAAADSTPDVTACMDVFDAADATPGEFWCPACDLLYNFHTGDAASGCPVCHGDLERDPSPSTSTSAISFADQAAAAMRADDGALEDTTSALLAEFGYAVRNGNGGTR